MRCLLGLTVAALLIVGIIGAVVVDRSGTGPSFAAVGPGPVVVRTDGRTLILETTDVPPCGFPRLVARERAADVQVELRLPPPPYLPRHAFCVDDVTRLRLVTVLPAPIGGRRIVDGVTGRRLPVVPEASLPQVTSLPVSYRDGGLSTLGDEFAEPGITRLYRAPDQPDLAVIVSRRPLKAPPPDLVTGRTTVADGRPATVHQIRSRGTVEDRRVVWSAYGWSIEVETTVADADALDEGGNPIPSEGELLTIARGIRPPLHQGT